MDEKYPFSGPKDHQLLQWTEMTRTEKMVTKIGKEIEKETKTKIEIEKKIEKTGIGREKGIEIETRIDLLEDICLQLGVGLDLALLFGSALQDRHHPAESDLLVRVHPISHPETETETETQKKFASPFPQFRLVVVEPVARLLLTDRLLALIHLSLSDDLLPSVENDLVRDLGRHTADDPEADLGLLLTNTRVITSLSQQSLPVLKTRQRKRKKKAKALATRKKNPTPNLKRKSTPKKSARMKPSPKRTVIPTMIINLTPQKRTRNPIPSKPPYLHLSPHDSYEQPKTTNTQKTNNKNKRKRQATIFGNKHHKSKIKNKSSLGQTRAMTYDATRFCTSTDFPPRNPKASPPLLYPIIPISNSSS